MTRSHRLASISFLTTLLALGAGGCGGDGASDDGGSGGSGVEGDGGNGGSGSPSDAPTPTLPTATGTCPEFTEGDLTFTPQGTDPRTARIWVDPAAAASADGPILFYWYGTGGQPDQALA